MITERQGKSKIIVTVCYMLVILATSIMPMEQNLGQFQIIIDLKPHIQNLLHIPIFAFLAVLFLQVAKDCRLVGKKSIIIVLLFCIGFGVLNEVIQIVIPGRYASILDVIFNFIGAVIGIFLFKLVRQAPQIL